MKLVSFTLYSCLILFLLCGCLNVAFSQDNRVSRYISVAFIKSKSDEFLAIEKGTWAPVHRQLIKEGRKIAWYLYQVKYPSGSNVSYDYVRFDIFTEWKQVEAPYAGVNEIIKKTHPGLDVPAFNKQASQSRDLVWEQLYEVIAEAANKVKVPSKFMVVNQVKTVPDSESEYVNLERTYFKPFHAERVAIGIMNNWGLYKRMLPYGEKYEYNYVTLNGFTTWEDIMKNNPPGPWQKAHGNLNFNEIHDKILSKRITVNNELWELVAFAVED